MTFSARVAAMLPPALRAKPDPVPVEGKRCKCGDPSERYRCEECRPVYNLKTQERKRVQRRARGARVYECGRCGGTEHNARTCTAEVAA